MACAALLSLFYSAQDSVEHTAIHVASSDPWSLIVFQEWHATKSCIDIEPMIL